MIDIKRMRISRVKIREKVELEEGNYIDIESSQRE